MAFPGILVSFYKLKHPNRLKIEIKAFFVGIGAYFNSTVFLFFLNPKDINISDIWNRFIVYAIILIFAGTLWCIITLITGKDFQFGNKENI